MSAESLTQEEKLISVLRREEQAAQQWQDSALTTARMDALDYYDRKPYGDEVEGQSKVVTSEFADTVESVMPSVMRVFAGTDQVVSFTPRKPGDEKWAKEANDYIPHVFMRENDGYRIIYWFCKDALMYRLAGGCVDLDEVEEAKTEDVPTMSAADWVVARYTLEQKAKAEKAEIEFDVKAEELSQDQVALGAPDMVSGKVTVRRKVQRVIADNIAPEDILFSADCRDIDEASFAGYRKRTTGSALRTLGLTQERIDNLNSDRTYTVEQTQREPNGVEVSPRQNKGDSERPLWIVVAYVRFDANEDGISELLRVVYAHSGGQTAEIIEQSEWTDGVAPVFLGSPILMSHTLVGRSLFDQVKDLQDVSSALTRGMLDNVYLTNRPRPTVSDKVNLEDVIDWTPGQPIRLQQGALPGEGHVAWLETPSIIGPALTALQHMDNAKEKRTGLTAYNQGLDAESLNKTATGIGIIASAAEQRLELIARTLAEGAIKRMYRLLYRAVKRGASGPVQYWKGRAWANCDPTQWPDDMALVVDVGPGTSNKQIQIQNLMMMGQAQAKLVEAQGGPTGPAVTLEHATNTVRKMGEALGFKDTSQFVASEEQIKAEEAKPKQPQPNPDLVKAQMQAEAKKAEQEADFVLAQQKQQSDAILARGKAEQELELKRLVAAEELNLLRERNAMELAHKRDMADLDFELKSRELNMEAALKKYEIDNAPQPTSTNVPEQQVTQ